MGEIIYTAIIEINPKTKKNSQNIYINSKTHRPFITQNDAYKKYEKECKYYLPQKNMKIDFPINIQAIYYRKDKRRVDLANLHEALLDILVKYGIIADDNYTIVHSMDGSRVMIDKVNPRTEITISRISI